MEDFTLGQLFSSGQKKLTYLEETSLASIDPKYQDLVKEAIADLNKALDLVERSAMFSTNEFIDDINASDLKFLLTSTYLAQAVLKDNKTDRASILKRAKALFEEFLSICQDHQLMKKVDADMYEKQSQGVRAPAAEQRQEKIARYKREKELKETIAQLREQLDDEKEQQRQRPTSRLDQDTEREWVLALIDLEILRALEQLHGIEQELDMVIQMDKMRLLERSDDRAALDDGRDPTKEQKEDNATLLDRKKQAKYSGPLLSKQGRPLQPFIITNKRQQLKDQVFQPGYNLPTMTVDEYLQQEMDRGNIIKGGEEPKKKEIDDNDHEALDAETMKQRDWDEFTEANPRGWGNRGNKG